MADAADEVVPVEGSQGEATQGAESGSCDSRPVGTTAIELREVSGDALNNGLTEDSVTCIITDETSSDWARSRFSYSLPFSSDVSALYSGVAKQSDYVEGTFSLTWRQNTNTLEDEMAMEPTSTATLYEVGMTASPAKMYLYIRDKNGTQPVKAEPGGEVTEVTSATPIISNNTSTTWTNTSYYSKYSWNVKSDTGFVGLVNQAMTCYLNSLIQSLYMTPEFRNALHMWRFTGDEKEQSKSIPYQLQRLFIHLQTSDKRAVETTDLTKSFGWDSSESWQQHDVQELCRVMFDALEKRFTKDNYERADLINELYQGTMVDYVKCLQCGTQSTRENHYLDISLVIKPFGSTTTYSSVEEALRAFVAPETLDGVNQYHCDKCQKKCDAHKGLKFKSFPYLLTMQLMRFDFDYSTMHRIKLNDKMSFPTVLNLNGFIDTEDRPAESADFNAADYSDFVVEKFDKPTHSNITSYIEDNAESAESPIEATEGPDIVKMLQEGPYVYELFSIMVHSGSAIGGHYYAYIKSLSDRHWYCFNDQSVSKITRADIEGTFGGSDSRSKGYYSSMYASSANAYMLMYRRVDQAANKEFMSGEAFPKHILEQIEAEKNRAEREKQRQEYEKSLCKFRLFCRHPINEEMFEKKLEVQHDVLLSDVTKQAYKLLELESVVPIERCRLVKYDEYTETLDQSFDDTEDATFGSLVGGARSFYSFELFMECLEEGQVFQVYKRGGLNLKLLFVSLPDQTVEGPKLFRAEQGWLVQELKESIAKRYKLPLDSMVVAMETYQNDGKPLLEPSRSLKNEGFYRRHTVFVCCDPEDCKLEFNQSQLCSVIDSYANSILLHVTVPPPPSNQDSSVDPAAGGESERPKQRVIQLRIDRRSTLETLKTQLETHVGLPSTQFKVYRVYSNNQDYEMIRLHDSLSTVPTDTKIIVRLGRALVPGEYRVKLYLLQINEVQFMKPILESIVSKGMSVREFKQQLKEEAIKHGIEQELDVERFRLRKKTWRSPGTVYLDRQLIDKDIHIFANFEMYVEPIKGPEPMTEPTMMQVYVRHWHPATHTVDPAGEIVLAETGIEHLKTRLAEHGGIPVEHIAFAKAYGSFPCELSVLDLEKDLDWNPSVLTISSMPLSMYDDGSVLYFKDSRETLAELSAEKKSELQKSENARLNKYSTSSGGYYSSYSRKERALKIYSEEEQRADESNN